VHLAALWDDTRAHSRKTAQWRRDVAKLPRESWPERPRFERSSSPSPVVEQEVPFSTMLDRVMEAGIAAGWRGAEGFLPGAVNTEIFKALEDQFGRKAALEAWQTTTHNDYGDAPEAADDNTVGAAESALPSFAEFLHRMYPEAARKIERRVLASRQATPAPRDFGELLADYDAATGHGTGKQKWDTENREVADRLRLIPARDLVQALQSVWTVEALSDGWNRVLGEALGDWPQTEEGWSREESRDAELSATLRGFIAALRTVNLGAYRHILKALGMRE